MADSVVVENNVTHNNDLGIKVGARVGRRRRDRPRRNNLIYDNDISGLVFGGIQSTAGRVTHSLFYSNTLYNNDTQNSGMGGCGSSTSTVLVSNNILMPRTTTS